MSAMKVLGRVILYWVCFIALLMGSGMLGGAFPYGVKRLMYGVLGSVSAFLITWVFLRVEKQSFASIGLVWERGTLIRLGRGVLIGVAFYAGVSLLLWTMSGGVLWPKLYAEVGMGALIGYGAIFFLALMEEVGFRSYSFLRLEGAFGLWVTQLVVAVAFALYHVVNGWSIYIAFMGPLAWAIVFGWSAVRSRGIAEPTGIHFAVNVLQNVVKIDGHVSASQTRVFEILVHVMVLAMALILTWRLRGRYH